MSSRPTGIALFERCQGVFARLFSEPNHLHELGVVRRQKEWVAKIDAYLLPPFSQFKCQCGDIDQDDSPIRSMA
jgi:hypothetical protein